MIRFENLSKSYWVNGHRKVVIDDLSAELPSGQSLALLGRNGAGKSTLLQMIGGLLPPDSGRVISEGTLSWPVGFGGSFHRALTGAQNVRFIARIYASIPIADRFVEDFADLGSISHARQKLFLWYAVTSRLRSLNGDSLRYLSRR